MHIINGTAELSSRCNKPRKHITEVNPTINFAGTQIAEFAREVYCSAIITQQCRRISWGSQIQVADTQIAARLSVA